MSDSLESADEIGTLEILRSGFELASGRYIESELRVRRGAEARPRDKTRAGQGEHKSWGLD